MARDWGASEGHGAGQGQGGRSAVCQLGSRGRDTAESNTLLLGDHPREPRCAKVPRDNFRRRGTDQREHFILPNALIVAREKWEGSVQAGPSSAGLQCNSLRPFGNAVVALGFRPLLLVQVF